VVTANKALLAKHGNEIFEAAERKGVIVAFEAAVAGGIPIIKALREGLAANRVEWIAGIINGTSNYILSTMRDEGITFAEALGRAQKLGYAEADPTFDIEGIDAAHKLTLLSAIAFGTPVNFDAAHVEGISTLSASDIKYAEQFGYRIKLLGITKRRENDGVELRVHPTLVPKRRLIANVEGVMNAVLVKGDAVGHSLYYGRGAGAQPTASAVIADLVDVVRMLGAAKEHQVPVLGARVSYMERPNWLHMDETVSSYYLRIAVADKPGVLAVIAGVLGDNNISIETLIQREAEAGEDQTDIVMLTHTAKEGDVRRAISVLEANDLVKSRIVMLRKEDLE
jgi:homoserine dehydrogenase